MLGIGRRTRRQTGEDLTAPFPHGRRQRRRGETRAEASETVRPIRRRGAEPRPDLTRRDALAHQRRVARLQTQRHLAADRPHAARKLPDTLLARVLADHPPQRPRREPHRPLRQPRGSVLRLDQVRQCNRDLLVLAVAGKLDDLEPIPQRRRDLRHLVRRRDEQHLRQIERHLHERVAKLLVLLRVQHLEQYRRRRRADLVQLVEQEHRVPAAHPPQLAQDPARLRILPGPVVATQFRLVPQPPAGQPEEPPPERPGRASRQRRLPHPGRAQQTQHRATARVPTPHGQVLEDARLGFVEARVPRIQSRADAGQVRHRRAATGPRQPLQPLDPVRLRRRRGGREAVRQPLTLPRDRRPHRRRQRLTGAEHLPDHRRRHHLRTLPPRRPALHHPTADRRQLRRQLRHARFVRVVLDHPPDRLRLEAHRARAGRHPPVLADAGRRRRRRPRGLQLPQRRNRHVRHHGRTLRAAYGFHRGLRRLGRQPARRRALGERARQQMPARDVDLLLHAVPRQLDHPQPLAHRRGNPVRFGRRHDPQRRGQVERNVDVRVIESAASLRIEHIEQHTGNLGVHHVDPLEDEDRVVDPGLAQARDDAPGAAVFGPVEQAPGVLPAQHHLHVGTAERRGRGHRQ